MGLAAVNIVKVADNLEKLKSGPAFWVYQERVVAKIQSEWSDQVLTSAIFDDIVSLYRRFSLFQKCCRPELLSNDLLPAIRLLAEMIKNGKLYNRE